MQQHGSRIAPGAARPLALAALLAALAPASALAPSAALAQPSAEEIARRSLDAFYYAGDDMITRVSMTLTNAEGKKRERVLTMLRKNLAMGGNQRYYIFLDSPADVKGMTFLVWKSPDKEDDRWIFVPAVNLVRRVAASDKRSSFVGSDFTYEDVSGRDPGDEEHKLLRTEELGGRPCFVLESTPKARLDYARRVSWIDQERWLPLKEEYLDARGETVREFSADEVQEVGGHWTVTKRSMRNLQSGHRTDVVFESVRYDAGLEEDLFTERYLRQPPRQWIQ